ncbi:unnamed protein product [Cuscuta epithymum]|uniref:Cyclic nucleotide-binding domain-containing protein n=1 Tax=Cuscuta epithymum TaxID=186058 RepID=A0AAV0EJ90_9ASTE|nr:unnamed protein product [Cuscuta epithymum]CAH9123863.1 unnamed protein product [Cuscuta epithymum]
MFHYFHYGLQLGYYDFELNCIRIIDFVSFFFSLKPFMLFDERKKINSVLLILYGQVSVKGPLSNSRKKCFPLNASVAAISLTSLKNMRGFGLKAQIEYFI